MEGNRCKQNVETSDFSPRESEETDSGTSEVSVHMHMDMEAIQANIIAVIQAVWVDVKKELTENIGQLKSELSAFIGEVSLKLKNIATNLKDIMDRVEQAEQTLADVKSGAPVLKSCFPTPWNLKTICKRSWRT